MIKKNNKQKQDKAIPTDTLKFPKICYICKKDLGKDYEWLGTPFYKNYHIVCADCYKDSQDKINSISTEGE